MELTLARRGRQLLAGAPPPRRIASRAASKDCPGRRGAGSRRFLAWWRATWIGAGRLRRCSSKDAEGPAAEVRKDVRDIAEGLGDFTATPRLLLISAFALGIGVVSAYVALALIRLIGLFTNLFFFQRWSTALVSPEGHTLGSFVVAVPVAGALVIGVMARYDRSGFAPRDPRGHRGHPHQRQRVERASAILKPLSSAISIGSGGPFGAEGPIIMTGGRDWFRSSRSCFISRSTERKTLLVARRQRRDGSDVSRRRSPPSFWPSSSSSSSGNAQPDSVRSRAPRRR